MQVRLNAIIQDSITDGPGINTVFVFQGCKANCPGCHNPDTHALDGGVLLDTNDIIKVKTKSTTGVTLSGGEPMLQLEAVKDLAMLAHKSKLTVTLYTGMSSETFMGIFPDYAEYLDYVKIGPYVESLRSSKVPYFGSSNQEFYKVMPDGSLGSWREESLK